MPPCDMPSHDSDRPLRMTSVRRILLAPVALLAALAGCSADSEPTRCDESADCAPGQLCQLGACFDACNSQRDCETGRTCIAGVCAAADRCGSEGACADGFVCEAGWCVAQQAECTRSSECPPGFTCIDGGCRIGADDAGLDCITRDDCAADEACVDNVCTPRATDAGTDTPGEDTEPPDTGVADVVDEPPAPDAGPDVGVDTPGEDTGACSFTSDCPDGFICDEFVCVPEGEDVGVPDTDPPDVPECGGFDTVCNRADDCCSGLCIPDAVGSSSGFCTDACSGWSDCNPAGRRDEFACLTVDDGGGGIDVCVPSDFEARCDSADDCLGGVCLRTPGESACTWDCSTGADCPDGSACGLLEFAGGDVRFVCAPIGNPCLTQDNCLSQTCLTPDGGGLGTCSVLCRADRDPCPSPWRCEEVDPTLPGVTVCTLE